MEEKAQGKLLLCGIPGECKPCTKGCRFFGTCLRNPHKRREQNSKAGKEGT